MIDLLVISTPTSVSSTTSLSSSLRDSETRLLVSIIGICYPASPSAANTFLTISVYRVHNSHDEENPKGTSQGNFAEVARGGTQSFFYLIYYIRKERERWTLFPRSPNSKSTTSTSRTRSSARCSRKSVSRSSSPARERDSPRNEDVPHRHRQDAYMPRQCDCVDENANIHSFFLKEEGSGAGRQVLVRALNYRSFLLK